VTLHSAAEAVSVREGWDGACAVVEPDVVVIDFIISAARDAMHAHRDLSWLLTARGRDPTTTKRSRTVAKIVKRRIGRPPDGGYGGGVIRVPQNYAIERAGIGPNYSHCKPLRINRYTQSPGNNLSTSG
jgi:hypothetical protein